MSIWFRDFGRLDLRNVEKENLTRNYLTIPLEFLERYWYSYWSKVAHTHDTLCILENIADTEYMKQDVFSEVDSQYVLIKTRINDLLKEEPATELTSNKTCCHNEYQRTNMPKIMLPEFDGNLNNWEDLRCSSQ